MHATAMFRVAAKLFTIAGWSPAARQPAIIQEAAEMLGGPGSVGALDLATEHLTGERTFVLLQPRPDSPRCNFFETVRKDTSDGISC